MAEPRRKRPYRYRYRRNPFGREFRKMVKLLARARIAYHKRHTKEISA